MENTTTNSEDKEENFLKPARYGEAVAKVKFVKPARYDEAVEKVKREGYVVLYGVTGSGKSTLAQYIVKNEFSKHQDLVLHLRGKQKHAPTFPSDRGILFWDDCFGIWNISDNENKGKILNDMKEIIDKCRRSPQTYKAVLCFDSFFFDKNQFRDYIANTMDLNTEFDYQVRKERFSDEMARNKNFVIKAVSKEVGFPLLISLILEDPHLEENKEDFLKDPTPFVQNKFQNLLKDHPEVYVNLIYAVCNCPVKLTEVSKEKWDILKKECEKAVNCESEKEQNSEENKIGNCDSSKNAKTKNVSELSEEADMRIPKTDYNSEKSKDSENSTPHTDIMGGGNKTTKDTNEGTDDCFRNDGKFAHDNFEKNRDKVEDDGDCLGSEDRSSNRFNVRGNKIQKRRKVVEMNEILDKYLVKNESQDAQFEFRHQFLADTLLRFHIKHVGKKGVSKAANEEVAFVLKKL